jgi:hypothetical protein
MFDAWNNMDLDLYRLNFSLLTLIPKELDVVIIQKLRPISLTNCTFKIFSKCVTNMLEVVHVDLISANQSAFIRGRYILESIVSSFPGHKIIHEIVRSGQSGYIFNSTMRMPIMWLLESSSLKYWILEGLAQNIFNFARHLDFFSKC